MINSITDYTEYEAKFYPVVKDEYRRRLQAAGAKLIMPECKMRRTIVDHIEYPQMTCTYVRVRDEGNIIRLSAKTTAQADGNLSDQKEIDVEVSDYDKMVKIIECLGFKFTIYQETLRETWEYKNAEITIDTWPGLDTYSEIEAHSEESVKQIVSDLGFDWERKIITTVKPIYMKVYGLSKEEVTDKLKHITFENNPFKNLRKSPF